MPKSSVTDPITDQEIAFAHLVLSGTMNDRDAAHAAGLNPTTAAYTKSKPRVREYMDEHRARVNEKLVDDEVEALRKLNLGRAQILARLWELARLSPNETKGSITGQIKAMAMIATIEGHLPNRIPNRINDGRPSPAAGYSEPPAGKAQMYVSEWMRKAQKEASQPDKSVTGEETEPTPPKPETPPGPVNETSSPHEDQGDADPAGSYPYDKGVSWVPNAIGPGLDKYTHPTSPLRPPFAPWKRFGRNR